ncbi:tetraspanin-8-like [Arachis duranensis]|uniref:Tetraspanin-8-like n=1 Tax=Arachis duranensis TaxID=130453 RepID=A0A6P4BA96_ARADU|nr:tetraspanin-8-like [Arachis duranensis]
MVRCSNIVIGILNLFTLILSIPILLAGVAMQKQAATECERWLDFPFMVVGIFLLVVSLAGLIGACCRSTCLLWLYLFVMFLFIISLFVFTVFAFVVTHKNVSEAISNKGIDDYKLGDYSKWLQRKVNDTKTWNKIKSCLQTGKVCSNNNYRHKFLDNAFKSIVDEKHTPAVERGCCKPPNECNFVNESPNVWTKPENGTYNNPDCDRWSNDENTLCYDCQSCKVGLLEDLKYDWKRLAIANMILVVILTFIYSIGCCAFRNNRRNNYYRKYR